MSEHAVIARNGNCSLRRTRDLSPEENQLASLRNGKAATLHDAPVLLGKNSRSIAHVVAFIYVRDAGCVWMFCRSIETVEAVCRSLLRQHFRADIMPRRRPAYSNTDHGTYLMSYQLAEESNRQPWVVKRYGRAATVESHREFLE